MPERVNLHIAPGDLITCDQPGRLLDRQEWSVQAKIHALLLSLIIPEEFPRSVRCREAQERIEQHAYHWWDDYRQQLWLFEPPAYLKALYQSTH